MNLDSVIGRTKGDHIRFVLSLVMDLLGLASYLGWFFPPSAAATEGSDFAFAPIQALYLLVAYRRWDGIAAALVGGVEEALPLTDAFPTCTLYHFYVMRRKYGKGDASGEVEPEAR